MGMVWLGLSLFILVSSVTFLMKDGFDGWSAFFAVNGLIGVVFFGYQLHQSTIGYERVSDRFNQLVENAEFVETQRITLLPLDDGSYFERFLAREGEFNFMFRTTDERGEFIGYTAELLPANSSDGVEFELIPQGANPYISVQELNLSEASIDAVVGARGINDRTHLFQEQIDYHLARRRVVFRVHSLD